MLAFYVAYPSIFEEVYILPFLFRRNIHFLASRDVCPGS